MSNSLPTATPEKAVSPRLTLAKPAASTATPVPVAVADGAPAKSSRAADWVFRCVIAVLILSSFILAWWSLGERLLPLQKQSRELSSKVAGLSALVDEQERAYADARALIISNRVAKAQNQLFADQAALEVWLANLKEQVIPLALDAKTDFGKTVPPMTNETDLALIPTTISVDVQPASVAQGYESPYQRILKLAQRLTAPGKRADLSELRVVSGTNSIASAVLVFHLWAGEENAR